MTNHTSQIIADISFSITSNLDIAIGLAETKEILAGCMPINEFILFSADEQNGQIQFLIRIGQKNESNSEKLSTFFLHSPEEKPLREKMQRQSENLHIYRRAALERELNIRIDHYLLEADVMPNADLLVLFDSNLQTGLIAVSREDELFTAEHISLFEKLKGPFRTAMSNALIYGKTAYMRDALADDNLLFREATVRLTSETDIPKAFHNTLTFLNRTVQLEEILLLTMNDDLREQRILLRADAAGTSTMTETMDRFNFGDGPVVTSDAVRKELERKLPDVFVANLNDASWKQHLRYFKFADRFTDLGIPQDAITIALGAKNIHSGVLFVFKSSVSVKQCMHVVETLKDPFVISLQNAIRFYALEDEKNRLAEENKTLLYEMQQEAGDRVIGMHDGLRHVMTLVSQVAPRPSPVLLIGETGTGKEVVATAIHRFSERNSGPFISLNCGAIPETLIDSELFGHERGAFTGASERKRGRFERANGGTLFLDEIGELPASAQVKLLRVLQEKEFERVGGSQIIRADVRLIAATHRDLPQMVRDGQFREDLFFRLNVFPVHIPPLRERRQDIPALTYFFIESKVRQLNLLFRPTLPASEMEKLMQYEWPGNVRELQNAIERALILSRGEPLHFPFIRNTIAQLVEQPNAISSANTHTDGVFLSYDESRKVYIESLLKRTRGKIAGPGGAAEIAKLNPSTLRSKIKKLNIRIEDI